MASLGGIDLSQLLTGVQQGLGDLLGGFRPETRNAALAGFAGERAGPDLFAGLTYGGQATAYAPPGGDPFQGYRAPGGGDLFGGFAGGGADLFGDLSYGGPDLFGDFGQAKARKDQADARYQAAQAAVAAAQGRPGGAGGTGATGADPNTDKWRELIDQAAAQYGIDGDAIQAVMMIESQGNPQARSGAGALGLMQVMPFHFGQGEDPWDPRTNVFKGASILADNYRRYGNWESAVAAYLGAVDANGRPTTATDMYGTSGIKYAELFNANMQRIKAARGRQPQGNAPVNAQGAAFPVVNYRGEIALHWGESRGAADIFAAAGTPVAAMRGGRVVSAGWSDIGGWNVTIQGDDGLTYYYAHLQAQPSVRAGQTLGAGTVFGAVGDTGNAKGTGAHLHLGIGYGIQSGTGPNGGAGINFDATSYLQQVLGVQAQPAR